jgi:ADP-ribose pyrophosphatase YjhB (NUDIX family)
MQRPSIHCTPDRYGGFICSTKGFEGDPEVFADVLEQALLDWNEMKVRGRKVFVTNKLKLTRAQRTRYVLCLYHGAGVAGLWFRVPTVHSELIAPLIDQGFEVHHAQVDYIMLTKWLPNDEPSLLPSYACTYVGVGGIVLDRSGNVLVVTEKYAPDSLVRWKFPGGHVEQGESFVAAIEREVFEETGVKSSFRSVISMRHNLQYMFGCSDLYVCCLLEPETTSITFDAAEIAQCRWMPVADFLADPNVYDVNKQLIAQCILHGSRRLPVIKRFPGSIKVGAVDRLFDIYRVDLRAEKAFAGKPLKATASLRSPSLQCHELLAENEIASIIAPSFASPTSAAKWA